MLDVTNTLRAYPTMLRAALAACAISACNGSGDATPAEPPESSETSFETQWPGSAGDSRGAGAETHSADARSAAAVPASPAAFGNAGANGASRAIAEADIIQLHGDRLYALSRMSGVNVVDVSDPAQLRLLGSFTDTRDAEPFEMYLREDVALVMFAGWGKYVEVQSAGEDQQPAYAFVQTSEVLALDVSDPAQITALGSYEIPGGISDSRIVGDVLYVIGYQDGHCWNCDEAGAQTTVVSLDVADPRAIAQIDALSFRDDDNSWGWNRRSVTVTAERMYVAGPEYGNGGPVGSSIQVVDISDPGGDMTLGATVEAAGEISSRWQMDEHQGVLRVISQPPSWRLTDPPVIQTFEVISSGEITALGRADMRLPRPEQLQSVRFDGPRAYAITFERTDPLFTIDLSDPATPRQVGELEIPGFVYHMEPRGDRVVGLGFDQANAEGSITVSIFDVSDMAQPSMLDRVNFGGAWGHLPEDQDRIHKVFRVLDEHGLILVPHTGYDGAQGECDRGSNGAVQLVDFSSDDLTLRGSLPSRGEARRAFLADEHVFTVNDQQVESFDIADRAAPTLRGSLALARHVTRALPLSGDLVARFTDDWWSDSLALDFVRAEDAHRPAAALGQIDLQTLVQQTDLCHGYTWVQDAFADGDSLIVLYQTENWSQVDAKREHGVLVIDASNPEAPRVVGQAGWELTEPWWTYDGFWAHGIPISNRGTARFEGGLAVMEARWIDDSSDHGREEIRLRIVDLRDPSNIETRTLALPGRHGYAGLNVSGTTLVTSHFEPIADRDASRFFLDRIDVSDPGAPLLRDPVNVPGVVMHYSAQEDYAVTMDLLRTRVEDVTWEQCAERFSSFELENYDYRTENGDCLGYQQVLRLVSLEGDVARLRDSHDIDVHENLRRLELGAGRLVGTIGRGGSYGRGPGLAIADCLGPCGFGYETAEPERLLVLSGFGEGELRTGTLELSADADPWYGWWGASGLVAAGQRALVTTHGELAIIDLTDAEHPVLERTAPFSGHAQAVEVAGDRVVLALGTQGCRVVDM